MPERETNVRSYECADAFRFATIVERDTAQLLLSGRQRVFLPRTWAMKGAKYRSGKTLFWRTSQWDALLRADGTKHEKCRRTPQRDTWVAARQRGVDMRAEGNEPPWQLDLKEENYIVFTTNYGQRRVVVPAPAPDSSQITLPMASTSDGAPDGPGAEGMETLRLFYDAATEDHALTVAVTQAPCFDATSGERYQKRVAVELDGDRFEGCGRVLR